LLVVVAIISLLVSILLPSLSRAKQMARRVMCMSHMRQMGSAMHIYINEHDGKIPPRTQTGDNSGYDARIMIWASYSLGGQNLSTPSQHGYLYDMLNSEMYLCPDNTARDWIRDGSQGYLYSVANYGVLAASAASLYVWGEPRFDANPARNWAIADVITWGGAIDYIPHNADSFNVLYRDGHVNNLSNPEGADGMNVDTLGLDGNNGTIGWVVFDAWVEQQ